MRAALVTNWLSVLLPYLAVPASGGVRLPLSSARFWCGTGYGEDRRLLQAQVCDSQSQNRGPHPGISCLEGAHKLTLKQAERASAASTCDFLALAGRTRARGT